MGIHDSVEELNRLGKRAYLGLILVVGGFCLGFAFATLTGNMLLIFIGAAIGIYGIRISAGTNKAYKQLYKDLFVMQPLSKNFDNLYYDWAQGFSEQAVASFSLCKMGNRFHSEDYIKASYEGIPFELSDVTVEYHTSGKNSHTTTYFKGRMLVIDFPEKMVNSVQIFSKSFNYRANHTNFGKPQKVEMESVEFNRAFDVRAVSPHDAFYLITPAFMERLALITMRTRSVAIHTCGNKMVIGFNEPSNNAFDASNMYKPISYPDEMDKVQKDIDDIKELITIIRSMQPAEDVARLDPYMNQGAYPGQGSYNPGQSVYRNTPQPVYQNDYYSSF
jgi:hypothetical protein